MDVWNYLSVLLHINFVLIVIYSTCITFFLLFLYLFLDVSDKVEVFNIACTSWWEYEIIDWLLFYFFRVNFYLIVEQHINVKKWHQASRSLVGLRARVVEIHL